ncbi:RusA family crossover junction endodeoxyribonuclease [Listeria welshimeri]|uniref:RusA family crossover junction endodeoxyribonuclease n=1 Tax=Listeria welshimeri TaxID=1643 RepID=UPI0016241371|nr:RusA family crossover junction endodeoxyribonuclease [Listeria welshimeri]MBC1342350.1 RusA family crossover junction endodeoxyribonuclease [Listeria welshimeri]MBC1350763.1 RusA family crossover junction endodeoxyribonuclease [Listeria welshimeri]MBF2342593.1 RusA family crossover junction endodeoxyribonuclease [Listeria welshimeri]
MWEYNIPIAPMPTPRLDFRYEPIAKKPIRYYKQEYINYLNDIRDYLHEQNAYNKNFFDIVSCENGVKAVILFYVKPRKDQKSAKSLFLKTKPDIDNLAKGVLDAIFHKDLKEKGTLLGIAETNDEGYFSFQYDKKLNKRSIIRASVDSRNSVTTKAIDKSYYKLTLNEISEDTTVATGTTEPNAEVVIKVKNKLIGRTTANEKGYYSANIIQQNTNTTVTASVKNTVNETTKVTINVIDKKNQNLTIDNVFLDNKEIRGTSLPHSQVELSVDGKGITDSRIVRLDTAKFTDIENPHIYIKLEKIGDINV